MLTKKDLAVSRRLRRALLDDQDAAVGRYGVNRVVVRRGASRPAFREANFHCLLIFHLVEKMLRLNDIGSRVARALRPTKAETRALRILARSRNPILSNLGERGLRIAERSPDKRRVEVRFRRERESLLRDTLLALVCIYRRFADRSKTRKGEYLTLCLPKILRGASIAPPSGKSRKSAWSPGAIRRTVSRAGGMRAADEMADQFLAFAQEHIVPELAAQKKGKHR